MVVGYIKYYFSKFSISKFSIKENKVVVWRWFVSEKTQTLVLEGSN